MSSPSVVLLQGGVINNACFSESSIIMALIIFYRFFACLSIQHSDILSISAVRVLSIERVYKQMFQYSLYSRTLWKCDIDIVCTYKFSSLWLHSKVSFQWMRKKGRRGRPKVFVRRGFSSDHFCVTFTQKVDSNPICKYLLLSIFFC